MRRWSLLAASGILVAGCGKDLTNGPAAGAAGADGGIDAPAGGDAGAAQEDAGAMRECARRSECPGTVLLDASFDRKTGVFELLGDATIDEAAGELRATDGVAAATLGLAGGARVCLEACMRVSYAPEGFGTATDDFAGLLAVDVRPAKSPLESVAYVDLGAARVPYFYAMVNDNADTGSKSVPGLPLGTWTHVRIELARGSDATFSLYVDGTLVGSTSLDAPSAEPSSVVVRAGVDPNGAHPTIDARFAGLRLTSP